MQLLIMYGDAVRADAPFEGNKDETVDDLLYTVKMKALYQYVRMVLRPVWDLPLTQVKVFDQLIKQTSNIDRFIPTLGKLQGLQEFINQIIKAKFTQEEMTYAFLRKSGHVPMQVMEEKV